MSVIAQVSKLNIETQRKVAAFVGAIVGDAACLHLGQDHDIFSRILRIHIYEFFYQILCNICFDFLKTDAFFDQFGIFLFHLRNIGEKIRRFAFKKIVKTCRELIIRLDL